MLNVEIRNSLASIIRQNGKRIAQDPVGLQTLLRSEAAQYPREIGMIVNAARAGIPKDIEDAGNAIYDLRPRMIEKLQTEQAFPQDVAEWVVETWISALSVADSAPVPPFAASAAPTPVQAAPVAPIAQAPVAPQQPAYAPPPQPAYPQYGQFPAQKSGSGKMIAIIIVSLVILAGLGVGGYFLFFKGKGTTPVVGTTSGTSTGTTGGTNPQDLFNTNGGGANGGGPGATGGSPGATGGGPGTTGGGPGVTGGGPGTDNGGGPGTNGGGPGGDNGGGANGGGPGATGGGNGDTSVAGTYGLQADPPQQGLTGSLVINQDMSYILDFAAPDTGKMISFEMRGKIQASPDGHSIMLNCDQATLNGQPVNSPGNLTTGLAPESASKFDWTGAIPEKMQSNVPGLKLYWTK